MWTFSALSVGESLRGRLNIVFRSTQPNFLLLLPQDWQLQIRFVRLHDAGWYECAVSSHPSISLFVQLHVTESKAKIDGPPERYLKPGSMLRLTCRILDNIENPLFIFWYHNVRMVNYDSHLGINVTVQLGERKFRGSLIGFHSCTQKAAETFDSFSLSLLRSPPNRTPSLVMPRRTRADNKFSELLIVQTTVTNSGNYSCLASNAAASSVIVHILYGEHGVLANRGFMH